MCLWLDTYAKLLSIRVVLIPNTLLAPECDVCISLFLPALGTVIKRLYIFEIIACKIDVI